MADTQLDITSVISSPEFKAAKPEVQKALLLKHFPDRYNNATGDEDFFAVTGGGSSSATSATSTPPRPSFYDKPLFSFTQSTNRGYAEESQGIPAKAERVNVSPRTAAEQIPTIAAMIATGGLGPGAGLLTRALVAGAAGGAGGAVQQGVEKLADAPPSPSMFGDNPLGRILGAGGEQAIGETIAGGLGKIGKAIKSRYLPDTAEFRAGEALSATMEKKLKPQEISPIPGGKEKKLKELESIAREELDKKFGPTLFPTDAGRAIADINTTASEVAHAISRKNYEPTNALKVDLAPYSELLANIDSKYLPESLKRGLHKVTKAKAKMEEPETVMRLARKVVEGDSQLRAVPFTELQELRTALRTAATPSNAVAADTTSMQLNKLANRIGAILDSEAEKAGVGKQWRAADTWHRETIGDVFDRGIGKEIEKIGISDPQRIVSLIKPNDKKAVEDLHKIFDFASMGGPEAAAKAVAARQAFERAFLDEKILNAPVGKWQGQIDSVGKDVYELVLSKDPAAAANLYRISGVMKRLAPDGDIPKDIAAFLAMQTGVIPASFGTQKNILRDAAIWAMPNVHKTREYVNALEWIGSKNPVNMVRGAKVLSALLQEKAKEEPPELLKRPADPSMPPAPFAPADAGMSPVFFHQNR